MKIDLTKEDWGGRVKILGGALTLRQAVTIGGIAIWIAVMLLRTGAGGIASLRTTAHFLLTLLVLSLLTRSISLRALTSVFLAGGFMMGAVAVAGKMVGLTYGSVATYACVAIVEEAAALAPVLLLLWRWRKRKLWTLGATDISLLFAFSGAGLALVETAYILQSRTIDQLPWFPVISWDGDRIRGTHLFNGHEIWTCIAGQSIGVAWLLRSKGSAVWLIALAGIALGIIDHFCLDARGGGFMVDALAGITLQGYLVLAIFVLGLISTITLDAYVIYKTMPDYLWTLLRRPMWTRTGLSSLLRLRSLAFANYQMEHAPQHIQSTLADICLELTDRLILQRKHDA